MGWLSALGSQLRMLGIRFWLTFGLACVAAEGIEMGVHHMASHRSEQDGHVDSLMVATGLYQRIVTSQRTPTVHYTAITEIDAARDIPSVSLHNVCAERAFIARLIGRIAIDKPSVIVIDKVFGADTCPPDDEGTLALAGAVRSARAASVPVLIGTADYNGHRVFASEVLCGPQLAKVEKWQACDAGAPVPVTLRGRVVLIGETDARVDQHRTIVGHIPGFYLMQPLQRLPTHLGWAPRFPPTPAY